MQALDPQKISDNLTKLQKKMVDLSDEIGALSDQLGGSQGAMKTVVAPLLDQLSDAIYAQADSPKPFAISQISQYMDSMPLKDLKDPGHVKRSELRTQIDDKERAAEQEFTEDDLIPDTRGGPKSAIEKEAAQPIVQESRPLENFFKKQGGVSKNKFNETVMGKAVRGLTETGFVGIDLDPDVAAQIHQNVGGSARSPMLESIAKTVRPTDRRLGEQNLTIEAMNQSGAADYTPLSEQIVRTAIDQRYPISGRDATADDHLSESNFNWQSFRVPGGSAGLPGLSLSELEESGQAILTNDGAKRQIA